MPDTSRGTGLLARRSRAWPRGLAVLNAPQISLPSTHAAMGAQRCAEDHKGKGAEHRGDQNDHDDILPGHRKLIAQEEKSEAKHTCGKNMSDYSRRKAHGSPVVRFVVNRLPGEACGSEYKRGTKCGIVMGNDAIG